MVIIPRWWHRVGIIRIRIRTWPIIAAMLGPLTGAPVGLRIIGSSTRIETTAVRMTNRSDLFDGAAAARGAIEIGAIADTATGIVEIVVVSRDAALLTFATGSSRK
jgi:hypothetical protein